MPPQPNGAGNPQDQRVALQAHKPPDLTAMPLRRNEEEEDDDHNGSRWHRRHYNPPPPTPPPPAPSSQPYRHAYIWQVLASVSAAGVIGIWVWMFNVAVEIRAIAGFRETLLDIATDHRRMHEMVERNNNRLTAIETDIRHLSRELDERRGNFGLQDYGRIRGRSNSPTEDRLDDDRVP